MLRWSGGIVKNDHAHAYPGSMVLLDTPLKLFRASFMGTINKTGEGGADLGKDYWCGNGVAQTFLAKPTHHGGGWRQPGYAVIFGDSDVDRITGRNVGDRDHQCPSFLPWAGVSQAQQQPGLSIVNPSIISQPFENQGCKPDNICRICLRPHAELRG